jgi:undecaprenyl diphosphate synthase
MFIPNHVGIIAEGMEERDLGHDISRLSDCRRGLRALQRTIGAAADLGIKYLTVRGPELTLLLPASSQMLARFVRRSFADFLLFLSQYKVKVRIFGASEDLSADLLSAVREIETATENNRGLTVLLLLNYGGRQEILAATREIVRKAKMGEIAASGISEELFSRSLETYDVPDPELIISTAGRHCLSDFLLWQCAYSEFVFVPTPWREFDGGALIAAVREFGKRDRRFGGLSRRA